MKDRIVEVDINHLKPVMKSLKSVDEIPLPTIVMAKVDGEFSVLYHNLKDCYTVNRWGRLRQDFPALNELCTTLRRRQLNDVVLLCELCAIEEDGKPANLPTFIHIAKGTDDHTRLRLGVWELVSIQGEKVEKDYGWRMNEVSEWLEDCKYCHVLPYIRAETRQEVEQFWKERVEDDGYEGVVAHSGDKIYKVKPTRDVDAVIIGLNKRELFREKKITSFKVGLMVEDGTLVELSDVASGINHELREFLWRLMEYKVDEDDEMVWIKPFVVATLEYTETFKSARQTWRFEDGQYIRTGEREFYSLRHPRLVGFRSDKSANPRDLSLQQI